MVMVVVVGAASVSGHCLCCSACISLTTVSLLTCCHVLLTRQTALSRWSSIRAGLPLPGAGHRHRHFPLTTTILQLLQLLPFLLLLLMLMLMLMSMPQLLLPLLLPLSRRLLLFGHRLNAATTTAASVVGGTRAREEPDERRSRQADAGDVSRTFIAASVNAARSHMASGSRLFFVSLQDSVRCSSPQ